MSDGIRDSGFGIRIPDPSRIPKPNRIPNPKSRIPALLIAAVLGIGYIRIAPGNFGSAAGLLVCAIMPSAALVQGVAIAGLLVIGACSRSITAEHFMRIDSQKVPTHQ